MRTATASRARDFARTAFLASVIALAITSDHTQIRAQQAATVPPAGESVTALPDGSALLIGGEHTRGLVQIRAADGSVATLDVSPLTPRAWHTATLLSDGSVLLVGGTDAAGTTLAAPERFVPSTQTFEALPVDGFAPRAHHTATLLTDGRVLLVGGTPNDVLGDDADVWDPATQIAQPVSSMLAASRRDQTATLLADGRVLLTGGEAGDGSVAPSTEIFDPATNQFLTVDGPPVESNALYVTYVSPANGTSNVPGDSMIAIRFSQPVDARSVSDDTVGLSGPGGAVTTMLVPAEGGRLVFVRPSDTLQPSSTYRLNLTRLVSVRGESVAPTAFSFTTKDPPDQANQADTGIWTPNGADGWRVNAGSSPWQSLPPRMAPGGVTALSGQVLKLDGRPLADVTLAIDGHEAASDKTGRFLLLLPGEVTGRHVLEIQGASANKPGRTYGFFEAGLALTAGQTTVLPYTIWMPRLDTAHTVRIPSPTTSDTVITTPFIPGLELHLPAGTVIKDDEGQIVRELGITPIPLDRPPFPLPQDAQVPIYFTIQPGGAYLYNVNPAAPKGGQLVYPNYRHEATGIIARFMHYDPDLLDWYVYGWGTVRGPQVFPDAKTRLYSLTGAMFLTSPSPPGTAPAPGGGSRGGDPVDLGTGLFVLEKTDLYLPDVIPLALHRTYRPADPVVRPFGIGATQDYAMFLWSAQEYQQVDLIMPDGGRVHYVRTSPGTGYTDAVFEHTATPTRFYKSTITWNGTGGTCGCETARSTSSVRWRHCRRSEIGSATPSRSRTQTVRPAT
ncbi:MAG: kelch repeat-containing protein [Vicinamibacterales bacterium]